MISSHEEIHYLQDRAVNSLITRPHVFGVGIKHDHPSHTLRVYTTRADLIGDTFEGAPVDQVVVDPFDAGPEPFSQPGLEQKQRPALGGVSIGPADMDLAGTMGSAVYNEAGLKLFLSNYHVLALGEQVGAPILQPARIDGGEWPDDYFGTLESWGRLLRPSEGYNKVDAALGSPVAPESLSLDVWGIGQVRGHAQAYEGQQVVLASRGGLTYGTIFDTDGIFKVKGYPWGQTMFEDQVVVAPAIEPHGASGGLLVDRAGGQAVGLAFAGNSTFSLANKATNVSEALGVHWGFY